MSQLLVSTVNYGMVEGIGLWISCMIFLRHLPKRRGYAVFSGLMLVLGMAMAELLFNLSPSNLREVLIPVAGLFYGILVGILCTRSKPSMTVYLSIWSVFVYSAAYELRQFLAFSVGGGHPLASEQLIQVELIWNAVVLAAFTVLCFTVQLWMPVYRTDHVGPRQSTSAILLYIIFVALMMGFYEDGVFNPRGVNGVVLAMAQFYCVTVLYLQANLFRKSALRHELDTMKLLWNQQKAQYEKSKESIAIINQKCHDLKHQLAALRHMPPTPEQERYLREVQESVDIYDSMVKTGNDTLDTVLTEKSLTCRANGITISCVADGARLNFMNPVDIYTVMGNALDNAVEAVQKVENPELRVIDVVLYARGNLLVLTVTNPLSGVPEFEDGIPKTTKEQNGYHGFGMPGMRNTVRRYGGELTASVDNGCFVLKILLPIEG